MKKHPSSFLVPVVAIAALLLASLPTKAALVPMASRRFPGSACVQVAGAGILKITNDGAIFNDAPFMGSAVVVDCPVHSNGATPGFAADADLWYLDHSTTFISCTYKAHDHLTTATNQQTINSTGDDSQYRKMTFNVGVFNNGFVHIRCSIPSRDPAGNASYIVGYAGW